MRYTGSESSWVTVEQPTASVSKQISITDSKTLWNLLSTGDLVRSTWPHSSGSWQIVDVNSANVAIAVEGEEFYKLQSDGLVVYLNMKEYYLQVIEDAGIFCVVGIMMGRFGDIRGRSRFGSSWMIMGM